MLKWHHAWWSQKPILPHPRSAQYERARKKQILISLAAMCGPLDIDNPAPPITVMLPDEDWPQPRPPANGDQGTTWTRWGLAPPPDPGARGQALWTP